MNLIAFIFAASVTTAKVNPVELTGAQALTLSRIMQKYDVGNTDGGHFNVNMRLLSCTGPNDLDAHSKVAVVCYLKGFNALDKSHSSALSSTNEKNRADVLALFNLLKESADTEYKREPRVRTISAHNLHCEGATSTDLSPKCRFEL